MEPAVPVSESMLMSSKLAEVLGRPGNRIIEELEDDTTGFGPILPADLDIELCLSDRR